MCMNLIIGMDDRMGLSVIHILELFQENDCGTVDSASCNVWNSEIMIKYLAG